MSWNSRVERIAPFRLMSLLETAQAREVAGHDVIHLEVGEPDFPTPEPVEAGRAALSAGHTRYFLAAITPGTDFAFLDDEYHVRIAFTTGEARLEEAVCRLEHFLARR